MNLYSVDESEKDKFEKLRVNANFEEVLKNIMKFKEIREKHLKIQRLQQEYLEF